MQILPPKPSSLRVSVQGDEKMKAGLVVAILMALSLVVSTTCMAVPPSYTIIGLGTLGGSESDGMDINELGHVTGYAVTPSSQNHAFLWDGTMHDLGALGGGVSYAGNIDDRDWVVGQSIAWDGSDHAILYHDNVLSDYGVVGTYQGNDLNIKDKNTNSKGEFIGQIVVGTSRHAGVWQNGVPLDIGTLSGGTNGQPFDINEKSQIVGYDFHLQTAILWDNYVPYDLNSLIPANTGWYLTKATGINETGQISGCARYNGHQYAFLATPVAPVPEPSSWMGLGALLAPIGIIGLKRRGK